MQQSCNEWKREGCESGTMWFVYMIREREMWQNEFFFCEARGKSRVHYM